MANCLVMGANGFIGSHLVDALAREGHFVRCFDRYKSDTNRFNKPTGGNIEVFAGDFLNRSSLYEALDGIDYVFHFISTTNPLVSDADPFIDIETNVRMSVELFALCAERDIKRVIFASTGGAIYGNVARKGAIAEDTCPNPFSPYAIGKLTIENYLNYFAHKHNLKGTAIRISNPYGPRQNILSGQGVVPIFLNKARLNESITVYGDGEMVRDYIYIDDLVNMILPLIDHEPKFAVYNFGSGEGHSVNQLVKAIEKVTGKTLKKEFRPAPSTYVDTVVLDNSRYLSEFAVKPKTTFEEGITKMWSHIQDEYKEK